MPAPKKTPTLLVAIFVVYLLLLTWIILWKLEAPWVGAAAGFARPIKLMPFLATADAGASAPLEVAANIAFFVPFGLYLGLLAASWPWWKATGVFVAFSLGLETVQHLISTGTFDSTDVIANTAGGMIGLGVLALVRRGLQERTPDVVTRVLLVGTVLSLVATGAFIASPLHYAQPRDVIFPTPSG